jgi:glycerophosphoryl diester phosphodiesterase
MIEQFLKFAEKGADVIFGLRHFPEPSAGHRPPIIAHRGAWDEDHLENTLPAFKRARGLGADGIEFDVHFTQDGEPVVHHDETLARLFNHPGALKGMTLNQVKSVTEKIPTLCDVLAIKGLHFMIEIKVPMSMAQIDRLLEDLNSLNPVRDYHLLTIDPSLVRVHPKLPSGVWFLVGELNLKAKISLAIEKGYAGVAGHYLGLSKNSLELLHSHGKKAGAGFIPNKNLLHREWARGTDFVFTNSAHRLY